MAEKRDRSKLYQKEYDILLLMIGSGDFTTKARFVEKVGKYDERRTKSF